MSTALSLSGVSPSAKHASMPASTSQGEEVERVSRAKQTVKGAGASFAVRSSATAEDLPDASFAGQQETFLKDRKSVV